METRAAATAIPLIVGKKGAAKLLGIPENTVKDLRQESLAAHRSGQVTVATLPECDRFIDDRPLWYSRTLAAYALASGRHMTLLQARKLLEQTPEPIPVMSQEDIANRFGIPLKTIRERWRNKYTRAIKRGEQPPASALVAEDFDVEGVMLWLPETIERWGRQTGKLNPDGTLRERRGSRWIAPAPAPVAEVEDALETLIRKGERWTRAHIAEFFGVKPRTVVMWGSGYGSGQHFPASNGGTRRDGSPLWIPATVIRWGVAEGRITEAGEVIRSVGGRPRAAAA